MMAGKGREGDWECAGCRNRNYAFRSLCNRCKQPRLLVDANTPRDSKWLPRVGDWICTGCSNNNYASRTNCKKCGLSKEEAALPAIALPGMSIPTYAHYLARTHGPSGRNMHFGINGSSHMQQQCWPYDLSSRYFFHATPGWPLGGINDKRIALAENSQFLNVPRDWRDGDWICECGFHNYSSRSECKQCNAPVPAGVLSAMARSMALDIPTLGTKRLASEDYVNYWDSKRLNAGNVDCQIWANDQHQLLLGLEHTEGSSNTLPAHRMHAKYIDDNISSISSVFSAPVSGAPALLGKGAKQWRNGDWVCNNCNNHNYASRMQCNRCKALKDESANHGSL